MTSPLLDIKALCAGLPNDGREDAPWTARTLPRMHCWEVVDANGHQVATCMNTLSYRPMFLAAARSAVPALIAECERLRAALQDISNIRDNITGGQCFNWSEHAYPLVAVLDRVGFPGVGHKIASKNLGTLIDQTKAAEAECERLREIAEEACAIGQRHTRALRAIMPKADRVVADDDRLQELTTALTTAGEG